MELKSHYPQPKSGSGREKGLHNFKASRLLLLLLSESGDSLGNSPFPVQKFLFASIDLSEQLKKMLETSVKLTSIAFV